MSAWKDYKQKLGETRPWHLVDESKLVADNKVAEDRMKICLSCDRLFSVTKQCRECGCFMTMKTKLQAAKCPLGKW